MRELPNGDFMCLDGHTIARAVKLEAELAEQQDKLMAIDAAKYSMDPMKSYQDYLNIITRNANYMQRVLDDYLEKTIPTIPEPEGTALCKPALLSKKKSFQFVGSARRKLIRR